MPLATNPFQSNGNHTPSAKNCVGREVYGGLGLSRFKSTSIIRQPLSVSEMNVYFCPVLGPGPGGEAICRSVGDWKIRIRAPGGPGKGPSAVSFCGHCGPVAAGAGGTAFWARAMERNAKNANVRTRTRRRGGSFILPGVEMGLPDESSPQNTPGELSNLLSSTPEIP